MPIRVTVWGENVHEQKNKIVADNYPTGMHNQIASLLAKDSNIVTKTTTLQEPEHGCTVEALANTDVLVWSRTRSSSVSPSASGKAWALSCCIRGTSPRSSSA